MTEQQPPAGMYDDPQNPGQQRYWDGTQWSAPGAGAVALKERKPVWKRWWFIGGGVFLLLVIGIAAAGGGESETVADAPQQTPAPASSVTAEASAAPAPAPAPAPAEPPPAPEPAEPELTAGQENAIRSAENYLSFQAFSKSGLIKQLEFEEYSTADATFAVENIEVDWNEQAAKSATNYLEIQAFSRAGLIQQLEFEGYTKAQAEYGATQAGL